MLLAPSVTIDFYHVDNTTIDKRSKVHTNKMGNYVSTFDRIESEKGLTDVGVLQLAADAGLSLQFLKVCNRNEKKGGY